MIGCMDINASLHTILTDQDSIIVDCHNKSDCNGFKEGTGLGKEVVITGTIRDRVVLSAL